MMFYRNIELYDYVLVVVPIFYCYGSAESFADIVGYIFFFLPAIQLFWKATDP